MNTEIGVGERRGQVGVEETGVKENPETGNGIGGLKQCPSAWCTMAITIFLGLLCVALLAAGIALIASGSALLAGAVFLVLALSVFLTITGPYCCSRENMCYKLAAATR